MEFDYFRNLYEHLPLPTIVCSKNDNYRIVFINSEARMIFCPKALNNNQSIFYLEKYLSNRNDQKLETFIEEIERNKVVKNYLFDTQTFDGKNLLVHVTANTILYNANEYILLFIEEDKYENISEPIDTEEVMSKILLTTCRAKNIEETIETILSILGIVLNVSRVYIFEDMDSNTPKNTYEWCSEDFNPILKNIKNLKNGYKTWYEFLNSIGMLVENDIRELNYDNRKILEEAQIKSIVVFPIFSCGNPIGYIGFDECADYREWQRYEIKLMQNSSLLISALIDKRNAEINASLNREILHTVANNVNSYIYVSDIDTHELLFVNRTLSKTLNKEPDELIGQICWQILQKDKTEPCDFCPKNLIVDKEGNPTGIDHNWEVQNTVTKKWYYVTDTVIKWVNNKYVHLESSVDISDRKQYEEKLRFYASMDLMTGTYKREWGYKFLDNANAQIKLTGLPKSICFIDIDGLKIVNDTYGHDIGDEMIINTINVIKSCIRKNDFICRWGGDEFILLCDCSGEDAKIVMNKIIKKIDKFNDTSNKVYKLSFSYGIEELNGSSNKLLDNVITSADKKMYQNKMKKYNYSNKNKEDLYEN